VATSAQAVDRCGVPARTHACRRASRLRLSGQAAFCHHRVLCACVGIGGDASLLTLAQRPDGRRLGWRVAAAGRPGATRRPEAATAGVPGSGVRAASDHEAAASGGQRRPVAASGGQWRPAAAKGAASHKGGSRGRRAGLCHPNGHLRHPLGMARDHHRVLRVGARPSSPRGHARARRSYVALCVSWLVWCWREACAPARACVAVRASLLYV